MDYPEYLKKLNSILSSLGDDGMSAYIKESALSVANENREDFLITLSSFCSAGDRGLSEKEYANDIECEIDEVLDKLDEISLGERTIGSRYNEKWLETQGHEVDPYDFFSPDGVISDIEKAVSLLSEAVDHRVYEKGATLALKLSELEVEVEGDCPDSPLSFDLLSSYNVVDVDMDTIVFQSLYLAYMGESEAEERAALMVRMLNNFGTSSFSLKEIFQTGEGVAPQSFLLVWIDALIENPPCDIDDHLEEALIMMDDKASALDAVFRYGASYPVLYRTILEYGSKWNIGSGEMLEIGLNAVAEVSVERKERSLISLITADYAVKENNTDTAEMLRFEAFRSRPDVTSFLRLRLNASSWEKYEDKVRRIYKGCRRKFELMFFDGRFDEVLAAADRSDMRSSEEIKTMYAASLFLLLLLKGSGGSAVRTLTENVTEEASFRTRDYLMGTGISSDTPSPIMFCRCFEKWKENFDIEQEKAALWLEKVASLIDKHASRVLDNNQRGYYVECAVLIRALCEVMESRGNADGKDDLLEDYRRRYSRKRSFISELMNRA